MESSFHSCCGEKRSVGEDSKIMDPSAVGPTRGGMFSVRGTGLQAVLFILLRSFGHDGWGLSTGDIFLSLREVSGWLGRGWSPPSFDCYSSLFLPLSTITSFLLFFSSPIFCPSFLPDLAPATVD